MPKQLNAFVMMPFHADFDGVYDSFIRPVLEDVGYEVTRADEIQSQQNIMKDVISGIESADVLVADLTDLNSNVFYELGIAHAVGKNVIMLTQDVDEVPFDLRPYRLIHYDTHFTRIEFARNALRVLAEKAARGDLQFGNPVNDFGKGGESRPIPRGPDTADASQSDESEPDVAKPDSESTERGLFDHLELVNTGYEQLTELINCFNENTVEWNGAIGRISTEMNALQQGSGAVAPRTAIRLSRKLASHTGDFNSELQQLNVKYSSISKEMDDSLEFVVGFQLRNPSANREELSETVESWASAIQSGEYAKDSVLGLIDQMRSFPRFEGELNREIDRSVDLLGVFAGNIDRTLSSISRAIAVWRKSQDEGNVPS